MFGSAQMANLKEAKEEMRKALNLRLQSLSPEEIACQCQIKCLHTHVLD